MSAGMRCGGGDGGVRECGRWGSEGVWEMGE